VFQNLREKLIIKYLKNHKILIVQASRSIGLGLNFLFSSVRKLHVYLQRVVCIKFGRKNVFLTSNTFGNYLEKVNAHKLVF
jgi:hypothetical protein